MTADLADRAFWAQPLAARDEALATLRRDRPVARFDGFVAVTRHADVLAVSRDADRFRSGSGATTMTDLPPEFLEFFGSIINMDDPRHTRLRRIVASGFTPRVLAAVEGSVRARAAAIVDDLVEAGRCDFVSEVAAKLPLQIICDMVGVGAAHHDYVYERSNVIVSDGDPEYVPDPDGFAAQLLEAAQELVALMEDLAAHRRRSPTDDLTSALVHANVDGEHLTHAELGSFFILLLSAGMETTRNAISAALWAFTEHPDQLAAWRADPAGVAPTAVEEIVRWASPIVFMRRTAAEDAIVGDEPVAAGEKLVLYYASANRDEAVFAEPHRFDVRRSPNEHVGFGAPGVHFCLGAHLARREIGVLWRELLERTPDLHATAPPVRLASTFINGIKHLPCSVA